MFTYRRFASLSLGVNLNKTLKPKQYPSGDCFEKLYREQFYRFPLFSNYCIPISGLHLSNPQYLNPLITTYTARKALFSSRAKSAYHKKPHRKMGLYEILLAPCTLLWATRKSLSRAIPRNDSHKIENRSFHLGYPTRQRGCIILWYILTSIRTLWISTLSMLLIKGVLFCYFQICCHHLRTHLFSCDFRLPT